MACFVVRALLLRDSVLHNVSFRPPVCNVGSFAMAIASS